MGAVSQSPGSLGRDDGRGTEIGIIPLLSTYPKGDERCETGRRDGNVSETGKRYDRRRNKRPFKVNGRNLFGKNWGPGSSQCVCVRE